jgi:periplasmic protein TonB
VPEQQVLAALETFRAAAAPGTSLAASFAYVSHEDAVRIGRALNRSTAPAPAGQTSAELFSIFSGGRERPTTAVPLAVSTTLHAGLFFAALFLTTAELAPAAATMDAQFDSMPLVYLAVPGPGGGGGGGGLRQKALPPAAEREGDRAMSSPLSARRPPKPVEAVPNPREAAQEPLKAESFPIVVAPVIALPADARSRIGVLDRTTAENDSRGSGSGGGVGTGAGTGIGEGEGTGIGPGSGGGTGGGPYRPGSGIEPPKLLHEVKPDYTEEARLRRIEGEVLMDVVVRRDGSVGDLKIVRGLGGGLNDCALRAVRQWRFSPARRLASPVDVIVQVSVEFKLR